MEALKPELDRFLSSPEANYGIATANGQDLVRDLTRPKSNFLFILVW